MLYDLRTCKKSLKGGRAQYSSTNSISAVAAAANAISADRIVLDLLDELGIANDTIVLYTADNGPHYNEWPDGGLSPFRGEKNTNLGGWLPRAHVCALAGQVQSRDRDQRQHLGPRLGADADGRGRQPGDQR